MLKYPLDDSAGPRGVIERFYLLGPFNNDGSVSSCEALATDYLADVYGGEHGLDLDRAVGAGIKYVIPAGFIVDLTPVTTNSGAVTYALALLESPAPQEVDFYLGSDDGYKLIVNDEEIGYLDTHRGLAPDTDHHRCMLRAGVNTVLMKVENSFGAYAFTLRVESPEPVSTLFDSLHGYPAETITFSDDGPKVADLTRRLKYSGIEYFSNLASEIEPKLSFKASAEFSTWQSELHEKIRELMGPEPPREDRPVVHKLYEEVTPDGLILEKIVLRAYRDSDIPCYLLHPRETAEELPVMLALHGHGAGSYPVAGVTFGTKYLKSAIETSNYDYGLKFAKEGFVVICPTARGFGERGEGTGHSCDTYALKATLLGYNLLGLNLYDFMRCIDYVQGLDYVDAERVGCIGHSNGGTFAYHLAAVDKRIKAAVISGAIGSHLEQIWNGGACGNQVLPGILQYADIDDIAASIAPRALCVESGLHDCCFMSSSFLKSHEKLREAFAAAGRPERLCIDLFEGPHRFNGEKSIDFVKSIFEVGG